MPGSYQEDRREWGNQKNQNKPHNNQVASYNTFMPDKCVFKTFYDSSNHLKLEIFTTCAEQMANLLSDSKPKMTQNSFRSLFNMLNAMNKRIKLEKGLDFGDVKEAFIIFERQCIYQASRNVIPNDFVSFVTQHRDVAIRSREEFRGFFEYLTSIMVRLKLKGR